MRAAAHPLDGVAGLGAVVVGLGGLVEPQTLGVGYDVIHDLLSGHMLAGAVATILVVKAVIWLAALSSGTSGGCSRRC